MRFDKAIDLFIADMRAQGRMRSQHTETSYRTTLEMHALDVSNRDPSKTGRLDAKRTLSRWDPPLSPETRNQRHAVLRRFYDWTMEEGIRKDNPARQVAQARGVKPQVYRMTRAETITLLHASRADRRDRWTAHLGVLAGLRAQELRGLQGRHLARDGWIWVSEDIGKGSKERWLPVITELEPIVDEIRTLITEPAQHVLPGRRRANPPHGSEMIDVTVAQSHSAIYQRVLRLGRRAQIAGRVTPHTLRHAFGDLIARHAGSRVAQALLGHESIETTVGTYLSDLSLDEIALAVSGLRIDMPQLPTPEHPGKPNVRPRST